MADDLGMRKENVDTPAQKIEPLEVPREGHIAFDYIKSSCFRVIRVDGAHGGITPRGDVIQIALFNERRPIPQREEYDIKDGKLTGKSNVKQRDAFIREVEVEALMSLDVARAIYTWLGDNIELAEQIAKKGIKNE